MNANELMVRITTEARGSSSHALIVDFLREKRREMLETVARVPDDELIAFKARVVQIEEIIFEITRPPVDVKRPKTGGYTV